MGTSLGGGIGDVVSYKAAGDLSGCQFYPVKMTAANTVGTCSDEADDWVGILQNKPEAANSPADVLLAGGISKVVTSGTIAAAGLIYVGSDGRCRAPLTADAANVKVVGLAIEASTATASAGGGDIITAHLLRSIGTTS